MHMNPTAVKATNGACEANLAIALRLNFNRCKFYQSTKVERSSSEILASEVASGDGDSICDVSADDTHGEDGANRGRAGEGEKSEKHSTRSTEHDGDNRRASERVNAVQIF
jgi:hypothetical protein